MEEKIFQMLNSCLLADEDDENTHGMGNKSTTLENAN